MSRDEAREVIEKCLKVLFYRDCRALNKVTATFSRPTLTDLMMMNAP